MQTVEAISSAAESESHREQAERDALRFIHESPCQLYLITTGIALNALTKLLAQPGASATIIGAQVPYSRKAFDDVAGWTDGSDYASPKAALQLSRVAYHKALQFKEETSTATPLIGIGIAGALRTKRQRRGEDRVHWSFYDGTAANLTSLHFARDLYSRPEQERIASALTLNGICRAAKVDYALDMKLNAEDRLTNDVTLISPL